MTIPLVPVLVAGVGVAYIASKQGDSYATPGYYGPYTPPSGTTIEQAAYQYSIMQPTGGQNLVLATDQFQVGSDGLTGFQRILAGQIASGAIVGQPVNQQSAWGATVDADMQAKLDYIQAQAKKVFDDMNEVGKQKAADNLNKALKLNPPLNGHETWEQISGACGAAAGTAAGTALCGPACGAIGAIVGAYLGTKLEDLVAKSYDDVKNWCSSKWGDISSTVKSGAKSVYNNTIGRLPF